MDERKITIFLAIMQEYIEKALPVGSNLVVDKYDFNLSAATIRSVMAELEHEGYIYHPHTSSGRVPTELGFRYYVENLLSLKALSRKKREILTRAFSQTRLHRRSSFKELAKTLASLSREAVVVAFDYNDVYYTGLSNLFSKPEFLRENVIYNLSRVVDHLDDLIFHIFDRLSQKPHILIGRENPLSSKCSLVVTKFHSRSQSGLLGILGPMRMDYAGNLALIKYGQELICCVT